VRGLRNLTRYDVEAVSMGIWLGPNRKNTLAQKSQTKSQKQNKTPIPNPKTTPPNL